MRFMMIVKASRDSEARVMPSERLLAEMGKRSARSSRPKTSAPSSPRLREQEERLRAEIATKQ
jgi:hypothetical protein